MTKKPETRIEVRPWEWPWTRCQRMRLAHLEGARDDDMRTPEAKAHLVKGADCWLWVVDHCPLCGRQHVHGGGSLASDPRQLLGFRVPHCCEDGSEPGCYLLVEEAPGA